jgi:hypothetical protein
MITASPRAGNKALRSLLPFFVAVAVALGLFATAQTGLVTNAHGKELTLEVSSFAPDLDQPQIKLFRVRVVYAGDLEPVEGALVRFSASRQRGGPQMDNAVLEALNEPGLYVGEVEFPLFGGWDITIAVEGFGEGEVSFVEDVQPASPDRGSTSDARQQVLSLFFRFDWKDAAAIAVRISHSLGGAIWFGLTGLILASFWFMPPAARTAVFARLVRFFRPATLFSLVLLSLSGVYTGIYSAPINPPGVFDFDVMTSIPFGTQYLAVIGLKVVIMAALMFLAVRISDGLKLASVRVVSGGATATGDHLMPVLREQSIADVERSLYRMVLANAVLGILLAVAVATAVYLHYISHLAVFVPS